MLIGYGTREHLDPTHRSSARGLVIGHPDDWNQGGGAAVVRRLTTLAWTKNHLHRVYSVIHRGTTARVLVIGHPDDWNQGGGAAVVRRLTTLAWTKDHLHRVYAVIHGGTIA